MTERVYRVLFLSRRNSARSVMAEAILNKIGKGRFEAVSAAVEPSATIDPMVADLLRTAEYPFEQQKPRHYSEFAGEGAQNLDFVFTLSDTAAGEPLPQWPGMPVSAHWSSPDPVHIEGQDWEKEQGLSRIMAELERRLGIFVNLPFGALDRMSLQRSVDDIAR